MPEFFEMKAESARKFAILILMMDCFIIFTRLFTRETVNATKKMIKNKQITNIT